MKIDLQKLLDALSEGTELDTLITDEVSGAELSAIESEAIEAGKAIAGAADRTPADADKIDQIVKVAQKVREVTAARAAAAAELDKALADKMALLDPAKDEVEEEAPAAEEAPAEEAPVVEAEAAPELVTAAITKAPVRVNVAEIKARIPAPKPVMASAASHLVAAADVPGVPAGASIDFDGLVASMGRRLLTLGTDTGMPIKGAQPQYAQVASLLRPENEFVVEGNANDNVVLEAAANERRLKGGSLTAAGSWCAPSEILYDLCDDGSSLDGLITLPRLAARRGGVQWSVGPDFCDVNSAVTAGFWNLTEAQVDAATVKPCFEIPCKTFQEARLNAFGMCLNGGLLMRSGYPELIADWLRKSAVAFAHYRNSYIIAQVVAGSRQDGLIAGCGAGTGGGAVGSILNAIENQVLSFRERHRMSFNATLELKAPYWVKAVIRADLIQRQGADLDLLSVPDSQIDAWFTQRGVNVEYLYDWQPLNTSCASGATASDYPGFAEFVLYKAGTWVEVNQPIISIDARFDASLTSTNRYGIRFTEEGLAIIKRCADSRKFQVKICPTGLTTAPAAACTCASI